MKWKFINKGKYVYIYITKKGGIVMKFVNPIGRTPGSGVQPRACMCTDGYAGYRGNDDGCVHCGCGCGGEGEYRTGNRVNAVATFRSSTL